MKTFFAILRGPQSRKPRVRRITVFWIAGTALLIVLGSWWNFGKSDRPHQRSTTVPADKNPSEANWPQFRGPTFDAVSLETGLAESWPDVGPPVIWTRDLGQGYSSFAAVGNRVFTQIQSLYRQSVVCLDAATGDTVWSYHYGWPFDGGGLYPGPRSTPTWNQGRIYFAAPDGMIGCLDAESGRLLWSGNPKKVHHGRGTDFGFASSPVVVDGRVIIPVGGIDKAGVVALDARTGSTIWTAGESSSSYATPLPVRWRERSIAIIPLENSIAGFDLDAGKQLWEVEFSEGYDEHSAAPIYREPYFVVASPFKAGAKCYRLVDNSIEAAGSPLENQNTPHVASAVPAAPGAPVVVWEALRFSNDVSSSVLVDGRLYGFDLKDPQSRLDRPSRGEFRCLDFETGRIIWSTSKVGQASIIAADQKLILFTDSGELILARSGNDEYTELARTQVFRDEICWTSPALHRGCVYVRTQTRAACVYLGASTFESQRSVQTVNDIPRGRAIDSKWLIGGEREFPATVPDWGEFLHWYEWSLVGLVLASFVSIAWQIAGRRRLFHRDRNLVIDESGPLDRSRELGDHSVRDAQKASEVSASAARVLFWAVAFLAGAIGSPLINSRQEEYVLLWPLALWAVFQMTINVITATERHPNRCRLRWYSRGCGIAFIAACLLYFSLCRALGYAIEWSFLVGFLPAFPVAAIAARFLTKRSRYWPVTDVIFAVISFSAYFWLSVLFIKWKLVVGS